MPSTLAQRGLLLGQGELVLGLEGRGRAPPARVGFGTFQLSVSCRLLLSCCRHRRRRCAGSHPHRSLPCEGTRGANVACVARQVVGGRAGTQLDHDGAAVLEVDGRAVVGARVDGEDSEEVAHAVASASNSHAWT